MRITRKSPFSGNLNTREIPCTEEQWAKWRRGQGNIQDIMQNLSADDCEFLMTGITPEEWDQYIKETGE